MTDNKRGVEVLCGVKTRKRTKSDREAYELALKSVALVREDLMSGGLQVDNTLKLARVIPPILGMSFGKRTLLSYFLAARADKTVVQELCALHKKHAPFDDLSKWDRMDREPNPIADCLLYGGADGVLRLLCEEFPECILQQQKRNSLHWKETPFQLYIAPFLGLDAKRPAPPLAKLVENLETLLEFTPSILECLSEQASFERMIGKMDGGDRECQTYLFEQFSKRNNKLGSFGFKNDDSKGEWKYDDISPVELILPHVENFTFENVKMSPQAFSSLLTALHNIQDPQIVCFDFCIPDLPLRSEDSEESPRHNIEDPQSTFSDFSIHNLGIENSRLLKESLKGFRKLRNLRFFQSDRSFLFDTDDMSPLLGLCGEVTDSNQQIESLTFEHPKLSTSTGLSQLISGFAFLKCLNLRQVELHNPEWSCFSVPPTCSIEKIHVAGKGHHNEDYLGNSDGDSDDDDSEDYKEDPPTWVKGFLAQIKDMPRLTELKVCKEDHSGDPENSWTDRVDVTDEIVAIMKENRLRSLTIDCAEYYVNIAKFSESLVHNTSLKFLKILGNKDSLAELSDVLETCNSTLERVTGRMGRTPHHYFLCTLPPIISDAKGEIAVYWAMLNRYGRAKLLNGSASVTDLLDGLLRRGTFGVQRAVRAAAHGSVSVGNNYVMGSSRSGVSITKPEQWLS